MSLPDFRIVPAERHREGGCGTSDLHVIENNQPLHDFREALGRGNEWSPACEDDLRDF